MPGIKILIKIVKANTTQKKTSPLLLRMVKFSDRKAFEMIAQNRSSRDCVT